MWQFIPKRQLLFLWMKENRMNPTCTGLPKSVVEVLNLVDGLWDFLFP